MIMPERTHLQQILPLQERSQSRLIRSIGGMKLSTLSSGTARPIYRIRTKSKTSEANGSLFKLAKGISACRMKRGEQGIRTNSREPTLSARRGPGDHYERDPVVFS